MPVPLLAIWKESGNHGERRSKLPVEAAFGLNSGLGRIVEMKFNQKAFDGWMVFRQVNEVRADNLKSQISKYCSDENAFNYQ